MPARHTVVCDDNHENEIFCGWEENVHDKTCPTCGKGVEILWKCEKDEYVVRMGLTDLL